MYDETKVDAVLAGVRHLASRPWVQSVTDHFASYFDELGLSITVAENASDSDIISLRNEIAVFLESSVPQTEDSFKWIVSFGRAGQTVDVISPGCGRRGPGERLPMLGKHSEFDG